MSLVPAETTAMVPFPYVLASRCKTMARASLRYSAPRTFFFTAANCFSSARVARMLPSCWASRAKICATFAGVLRSPRTPPASRRAARGGGQPLRSQDLRMAGGADAAPRRLAKVCRGEPARTICGWIRRSRGHSAVSTQPYELQSSISEPVQSLGVGRAGERASLGNHGRANFASQAGLIEMRQKHAAESARFHLPD